MNMIKNTATALLGAAALLVGIYGLQSSATAAEAPVAKAESCCTTASEAGCCTSGASACCAQ